MLQASVTTGSVTPPKDKAFALAASDKAVYKIVFCNNLFKLQSPPWTSLLLTNLLQRINMTLLTGYPVNPCLRSKPQQSWEITYLHFPSLPWKGAGLSQSLTNHTRLFRAYNPYNSGDHLCIRIAREEITFLLYLIESSQDSSKSLLSPPHRPVYMNTVSQDLQFPSRIPETEKVVSTIRAKPLLSLLYSEVGTYKTKERNGLMSENTSLHRDVGTH